MRWLRAELFSKVAQYDIKETLWEQHNNVWQSFFFSYVFFFQ